METPFPLLKKESIRQMDDTSSETHPSDATLWKKSLFLARILTFPGKALQEPKTLVAYVQQTGWKHPDTYFPSGMDA